MRMNLEPPLGKLDRWGRQLAQGRLPPPSVELRETDTLTGDTHCEPTNTTGVLLVGLNVHVSMRRGGCGLAEIEHSRRPVWRNDDCKATTAEAASGRLNNTDRQRRRDGCIHCVATPTQDVISDGRSEDMV